MNLKHFITHEARKVFLINIFHILFIFHILSPHIWPRKIYLVVFCCFHYKFINLNVVFCYVMYEMFVQMQINFHKKDIQKVQRKN